MDALYQLISAIAAPIMVVEAESKAPRPEQPYVTIKIKSVNVNLPNHKSDVVVDDGVMGRRIISAVREATFEMQCFSPAPVRDLSALVLSLQMEAAQELAVSLNVCLVGFTSIEHVPVLAEDVLVDMETSVEGVFRFTHNVDEQVHIFEQVNINQ